MILTPRLRLLAALGVVFAMLIAVDLAAVTALATGVAGFNGDQSDSASGRCAFFVAIVLLAATGPAANIVSGHRSTLAIPVILLAIGAVGVAVAGAT